MILILGRYPPEKCGVGDYAYNLLHSENAKDWYLYYSKEWKLKSLFEKIKEIKALEDNYINIQYPSLGFCRSLVPHILCMYFRISGSKHTSVTLHEFTQLGLMAKVFSIIFLIFSEKLIFTNEYDRDKANLLINIYSKSRVIKICSNINKSAKIVFPLNRQFDVCYFGYIRPKKGIESFLECVAKMKIVNNNIKFCIIGQTQLLYEEYYSKIIKNAETLGITLILNEDSSKVSDILADSKIAYLPYPDGISDRRGSFLACAQNGCLIVTTKGKFTSKAHEKICFFVHNSNCTEIIIDLLDKNDFFYNQYQENLKNYFNQEIPISWNQIAQFYNLFLLEKF